jgi:hypothetical protein
LVRFAICGDCEWEIIDEQQKHSHFSFYQGFEEKQTFRRNSHRNRVSSQFAYIVSEKKNHTPCKSPFPSSRDLWRNQLSGKIPKELGSLANLTEL